MYFIILILVADNSYFSVARMNPMTKGDLRRKGFWFTVQEEPLWWGGMAASSRHGRGVVAATGS